MNDFILSPAFCLHNGVLVLQSSANAIVFGLTDFSNEELKERLVRSVKSFYAPEEPELNFEFLERSEFTKKISILFSSGKEIEKNLSSKQEAEKSESAAAALLESILINACDENATDIHIEDSHVQFRVRGILKEISFLEHEQTLSLVRRIKVLANMNVAETRLPQDGQFSFSSPDGHSVYVRVSCVPSVLSESVVLRILDVARVPLKLSSLGFSKEQLETVECFCTLPFGLVLICGPTGSGKSTTAGAMLEHIQSVSDGKKKIVSIEEPPEYVLPGVTQIAVHAEQGVSFSSALRSVFKQDPDIIFIGEIRDSLTAQTAVQASLTGHLVFATLHTVSAEQALMRLEELGVGSAVVRSVVCGVIVQNLSPSGMSAVVKKMSEFA